MTAVDFRQPISYSAIIYPRRKFPISSKDAAAVKARLDDYISVLETNYVFCEGGIGDLNASYKNMKYMVCTDIKHIRNRCKCISFDTG